MFDTVFVEKALPLSPEVKKAFKGKDWKKIDFQTKDLDLAMAYYYLKANGNLYLEKIEGSYEPLSEEEIKKNKKNKFYLNYKFIETGRELVKTNICGTVQIYASEYDNAGNEWWVEFELVLHNGKLKKAKQIKAELVHTAEEIEQQRAEFKQHHEKVYNHPWNKTKRVLNKITFNYWNSSWRGIARGVRFLGSRLDNLGIWIYRYM